MDKQQIDMEDLRASVTSSISSQDLNTMKVAAICELSERIVREDPKRWKFLIELADLANAGERAAGDRGLDEIPWAALSQILRNTAKDVQQPQTR